VLVADAGNNKIWALADSGTGFSTFATAATLASTCEPANLAMGPVIRTGNNMYSARVYVACPNNGTFEVGTLANANGTISLAGFAVVSLPTNGASTPSPYGIAVNSTGTVLAVTDSANNDVVIYPSVNDARLGTPGILSVGSVPVGVGIDGGNVFVANEGSGTVSVVDPPSQPAVGQVQRAARRGSRSNGLRVSHTPLIAPLRSPPRR
jgi:DNA-binding beta-propeller fold protein YncE